MECCSATDRADVIIKFVEEDMIKEIYLLNELLKIHVSLPLSINHHRDSKDRAH